MLTDQFLRPEGGHAPGVPATVYVQRLINDELSQLMIHIGDRRMVFTLSPSNLDEILTNFKSVPVVVLIPEGIEDKASAVAQFLKSFEKL